MGYLKKKFQKLRFKLSSVNLISKINKVRISDFTNVAGKTFGNYEKKRCHLYSNFGP